MHSVSFGSILPSTEGLLLPQGEAPDEHTLDLEVRGLELHQAGVPTDYSGLLVLVAAPVRTQVELDALAEECADAVALILPHDIPRDLSSAGGPALLRRSPWVTTDALIRALTLLTRGPSVAADRLLAGVDETSGRDAALAEHRRESALLSLLNGTTDAALPAAIVGLRPDRTHVVLAVGVSADNHEAVQLALSAAYPNSHSVLSERVHFAVLPVEDAETAADVVSRLRMRLGRAVSNATDLPVGVGPAVPGVFSLNVSAAGAREILRALRFKLGTPALVDQGGPRIASDADVADALALIRAGDALRPLGPTLSAPLTLLANHDRAHQSDLLGTVLVALEHRNNTAEAARQLGIHANSLRARLDRVRELSGIDLSDPVSAMRTIVAFLASPVSHNSARHSDA